MDVIIVSDYEEMSDRAAEIVGSAIQEDPRLILGLATGSTPEGLYARLIEMNQQGELDFSEVMSFNLDEYVGLDPTHEQSYRYFMNEKLFDHINIDKSNTHVPDGQAASLSEECTRYEAAIEEAGGIDLQVLGIGRDGHVGFNEPGTSLASKTHIAALTEETVEDNSRFFERPQDVPRFAVTMGIQSILDARRCLLLASGANKAEAVRRTVEGPITSSVTASALQMHEDTVAIIDEEAATELERKDYYVWVQENMARIQDRM